MAFDFERMAQVQGFDSMNALRDTVVRECCLTHGCKKGRSGQPGVGGQPIEGAGAKVGRGR
ncbi:hypothetical protein ASE11_19035 [Hydrogenophaga sp. Root209]|nr:hypothetical protein ASE11_19035 [Hydrogenophaga sp. Root209]